MTDKAKSERSYLLIEFVLPGSCLYRLNAENVFAQQLWGVVPVINQLAEELYERQKETIASEQQASLAKAIASATHGKEGSN